ELGGTRILIHAEQGAGDTLQFARYVPMVAARGGRVVLLVQPELRRLFASLPGVEELVTGGPMIRAMVQCSLASLPHRFGTTLETIPASSSYLAADAALTAQWRERLKSFPGPKIGLVWAGNPEHRRDRDRSIAPGFLPPLLALPGFTFFSLQKFAPPPGLNVMSLAGALNDFADTAAVIAALDLVITVDTSVAHLAGALGRPVWILLPAIPDWRWLLAREDSPWYPSARLFRQERHGAWKGVIERVAAVLSQHFPGR
ncbi:MAG TPA: glycosyltransferase family 9 protein, partial [Stellaceae bacterium]|nr:glycosyltransferase family 9 protein [Stellaceae bacterium]